ncbi:MAG: hypothetical protein MZV63_55795 [Marinilabiliales bacterium]|nr:hypothetical protein [Marinilabiliales bacterium]
MRPISRNNLNSPTAMIALLPLTGSPRNYDYWYIDDVSITGHRAIGSEALLPPQQTGTPRATGEHNLVPTATTNCYIPGAALPADCFQ